MTLARFPNGPANGCRTAPQGAKLQGCGDRYGGLRSYAMCMIVLSHTTALDCLHHLGAESVARMPRMPIGQIPSTTASATEAAIRCESLCQSLLIAPDKLHLLTPQTHRRESSDFIRFHTTNDGSAPLIRLANDIFIASPELVVQQLSESASLVSLTRLVYELCGVYSHPTNERVLLSERKTFSSISNLRGHLESRRPFRGADTLDTALRLAHNRSGSHMETACAILLGFPYRLGGLNFPKFEMNRKYAVPKKLVRHAGRRLCYGDLCWPERGVILEYESNEHHTGAERIAADSGRRNALQLIGQRVLTLTGKQLYDAREFNRTAYSLAAELEHRIRPQCENFSARHNALRHAALYDPATSFGVLR